MATAAQPRAPVSPSGCTRLDGPKDCPRLRDVAMRTTDRSDSRAVQTTAMRSGDTATRGACSPARRTEPTTSLTCTGGPNDRPPSWLVLAKTSAPPLAGAPVQVTTASEPAAAVETLALFRPAT